MFAGKANDNSVFSAIKSGHTQRRTGRSESTTNRTGISWA
jgi:hypothetical protein